MREIADAKRALALSSRMRRSRLLPLLLLGLAACTPAGSQVGLDLGAPAGPSPLPILQPADPQRAAAGLAHFSDGTLARPLVPLQAMRSLFYVWGGTPPASDAAYWTAFAERYGFAEAPYPNDGLPVGLRLVAGTSVTFDCRMCHADVVAGQVVIGAGNSRLDYQGLMDDLQALANLAATFGFPQYQNPVAGQHRTGAAGAHDAMGLGFWLSTQYAPPPSNLHTDLGFQQAAPWWNLKWKTRMYSDGSGSVLGNRTMMSMFLSFGMSMAELMSLDDAMEDVRHYLLSIEPPAWPFSAPGADEVTRGRAIFVSECASCHGSYGGATAHYPETIVDRASVGTDPTRAERLTSVETGWVNASWFGAKHPMQASGGYLAPPLVGVWASAPYLHNGSVPDLRSLLRPAERPARWRRTGHGALDYDEARVGWRYTSEPSASASTIDGRRTYDTTDSTRAGLGNQGHAYGTSLADSEIDDLLAYLKTL